MGEVWLARDTRLGRKAAVKLLPAEFTSQPERVRRFEQEERARPRRLNHPNIVTSMKSAKSKDALHIVTEYVEGKRHAPNACNGGSSTQALKSPSAVNLRSRPRK